MNATLLARDFPATTAALADIRAAVRAAIVAAGGGDDCAAGWVLATNEACMNIIQHGYRFADGQSLRIEISAERGELVALVCDNGAPVCIEALQSRQLDELRPGGLGVHFIRELTDTMAYLPPAGGWRNRLRLSGKLPAGTARDSEEQAPT